MFDHIGVPEILLILVIVFIFFGAGKLPQVASGLGKAVRNFKKAQRGDFDEEDEQKTSQEVMATTKKPEVAKLSSSNSSETASKSS